MKKISGFVFTLLISFSLILIGIQDVEARRFGGARSFGGKSSYRTPYRKSTSSKTRSASQQRAHQQNQAARQSMTRRGGFMGMLGGLALGGLLGSMFFGGAFENINLMDILVFGGIAYLLLRLLAAKANPGGVTASRHPAFRNQQYSDYSQNDTIGRQQQRSSGFDTDILFNNKNTSQFQPQTGSIDADFNETSFPAEFDEQAFLTGAKAAFTRLQVAWDNRDMGEIRSLTTDKVFMDIQEQLRNDTNVNKTDVLKVEAELLDFRTIGSELETVVLFDCIIREETDGRAEQVREVWNFIKSAGSTDPNWHLDGIQQMEN